MKRLKHILLSFLLLGGLAMGTDQAERAILKKDPPEYPKIAKDMNLHGAVKLKVWVKPDGSVRRLEYVGGHPLLAEAALKAVKSWKYAVAAKESTQLVEVKF
jgi:TonB family protein